MFRRSWLAAAAALAVACGRDGSVAKKSADVPPAGGTTPVPADPAPGGTPAGIACKGLVTVFVLGVDGGTIGTFDVDLAGLELTSKGAAVAPKWSTSGTLSLAGVGASQLAVVESTADETTEVTLRLGRIHVCEGSRCADLDLCTEPISFRVDADKVSPERCHAVLHLDLEKSIQALPGGGEAFLPRFSVHY